MRYVCFALLLLVRTAFAGCLSVDGDHILVRDVAAAIPEFASTMQDEVVALAPQPGLKRVLTGGELVRTAKRIGIELTHSPDLCFERVMRHLTAEEIGFVLQAAIGDPAVQIDIVDFSRNPVPPGELVFPKAALNRFPSESAGTETLWRGKVVYGQNSSVPVWARVKLSVERDTVQARVPLPAGAPVDPANLVVQPRKQFGLAKAPSSDPAEYAGRIPRRTIAPNEPLRPELFFPPVDVQKGDRVEVRVLTASTEIRFVALAESSGAKGQALVLKNPDSGKPFRAWVEGKGHAIVQEGRRF